MRDLRLDEVELINFMLEGTESYKHLMDDLHRTKVIDMDDGGMGSFKFVSSN